MFTSSSVDILVDMEKSNDKFSPGVVDNYIVEAIIGFKFDKELMFYVKWDKVLVKFMQISGSDA